MVNLFWLALINILFQNPIKSFERDWPMQDGQVVKRRHYAITSPRVLTEAREHFNCTDLIGAELEDQGGFGTALVHWEKRLFEVNS